MKRTLLIVDDVTLNRRVLAKILGDEYEILEAENGEQALAVIKREHERLSAVLLDLVMPVMDGFAVLDSMHADEEMSHIPVIITTGQTEEQSEVKALKLGANDYITKPYNATIIKQRIYNTIKLRETAATVNALQRDRLTGLYSREIFFDKAHEMIISKEPGYYVMSSFNIGGFKVINDQYGTAMGDEVLKHVANSISRFVAPLGGLCSRVSADNFAILYPSELIGTGALSENHMDTMAPACLDRQISVRIGRYVVDDLTVSASAMYDRATMAEASIKGRYDAYIAYYDESMRMNILNEQRIVNEMNGALEGGQFEVWFQPQFNHSSGALIGAEALVRWRHPERGIISPAEFIPVFERNGFIYELDKYIWEQACIHLKRWLSSKGESLPVSVNISRYDLFRDDLGEVMGALISKYGIPADLLRLEITESAFAQSTDLMIDAAEALVNMGFTVEIDDFGSGYSSLNVLKDVPAKILKLDMRFLESGRNSERGGNILESIVRMAKWLGMPVIAEGVETLEQADYLRSIGCHYIQGYLYARPMTAAEYDAVIESAPRERQTLELETVNNLDNNTFWDPKSMDTLIFNSYIGGACIFEYHNGRAELLRINENYVRELGVSLSATDAHSLELDRYMDAENRALLMDNILHAIESGAESSCEVRLVGLESAGVSTYIRTAVKVIARTGTRYLLYCAIFNMTALREAEIKQHDAYRQLQAIMDDMPGGFCRMKVLPDHTARIEYINDGFSGLVGMTHDELMEIYGQDALGGVHPDDIGEVRKAYGDIALHGGHLQINCRLRHGTKGYIASMLFGRVVKTESGDMYVHAYYTEITDKARTEEYRKELLDNLPCGAALLRFGGGSLTVEYLNKRYMELSGRTDGQLTLPFVTDAVHPDDREAMMAEIRNAIPENRDMHIDLRLRRANTADEYRPFRVYGRSVPNSDGSFSIYVTFSRLRDENAAPGGGRKI